MAITILQQPTEPNMANADLLFEVSSNVFTQPQFQYVVDVFNSGSSTLIQRVKQQPNPSGYGVFNMRQILSYQLDSDNVWKTAKFATSSLCNKDFVIKFGEEYGTSVSSSVFLYNGITNATSSLAPAKTGSSFYPITDGLVEPNEGGWNFPSSSYYTEEIASTNNTFNHQHNLSYAPTTQSIQDGEYATIALYNGNFANPSGDIDIVAQDIFYYQVDVYNAADTFIQGFGHYNIVSNGGGIRTVSTQLWDTVYNLQTNKTRLIHIGVGPENFAAAGNTLNSNWAYYTVTVHSQDDAGLDNNNGVWATLRFDKSSPQCIGNGVRFAWKNEFGVWDYYTFTLADSQTSAMERLDYQQTFVPFSTSTTSVPYSLARRGVKPFNTKITQDKTANSDWLTQAEADWIRELFYSTNVFIQDGSDFKPVVITTANIVEKTNPRTQKVYQYQIAFKLANQPRSRF